MSRNEKLALSHLVTSTLKVKFSYLRHMTPPRPFQTPLNSQPRHYRCFSDSKRVPHSVGKSRNCRADSCDFPTLQSVQASPDRGVRSPDFSGSVSPSDLFKGAKTSKKETAERRVNGSYLSYLLTHQNALLRTKEFNQSPELTTQGHFWKVRKLLFLKQRNEEKLIKELSIELDSDSRPESPECRKTKDRERNSKAFSMTGFEISGKSATFQRRRKKLIKMPPKRRLTDQVTKLADNHLLVKTFLPSIRMVERDEDES